LTVQYLFLFAPAALSWCRVWWSGHTISAQSRRQPAATCGGSLHYLLVSLIFDKLWSVVEWNKKKNNNGPLAVLKHFLSISIVLWLVLETALP